MTRAKTGGMQRGYTYKKKKHWYTNGIDETQIFDGTPIPEGFHLGRLPRNRPAWNFGLTKYTDSRVNLISQSKLGGTSGDALETRANFLIRNFADEAFISFWDDHTCKECLSHFNISWNDLHFLIDYLKLDSPQQHKKKLKDHIFDSNYRKKHSEILKGKNTWSKGRKQTKEHIEKHKISYLKRTDEDKFLSKQKEWETRERNGTNKRRVTKDERYVWEVLKKRFSSDDVLYEYFDVRYPYKCDFYVKSLDLFIEVNAYPSHGGHPFDERDENDKHTLLLWKEKATKHPQYTNWVYTWTDLDVRKFESAKHNKLNYLPIYDIEKIGGLLDEWICKNKKDKENSLR